jgi:hypothetical protein
MGASGDHSSERTTPGCGRGRAGGGGRAGWCGGDARGEGLDKGWEEGVGAGVGGAGRTLGVRDRKGTGKRESGWACVVRRAPAEIVRSEIKFFV